MIELDRIDRKILTTLQRDGALSQRDVASKVGLSQNACWRRIKRLNELGVIEGYDKVYKQLTSKLELETVTGLFAMETILENQPLSLS